MKKGKPRRLTLPLSDWDILALTRGNEIRRCFHQRNWRALAVIHSDGAEHVQAIERFDEARRDGYDILNIPLDKENLEQLSKGAVQCSYAKGQIEVTVTSRKVYDQVLAEMEGKSP